MGRKPCCSKMELKRGHWTSQEDQILVDYVRIHGEGKWRDLAQKTGLKRCGKSCRLRWLNYLRPGIKLGNISEDEEDLIIKLHRLLGNRWTLIAGRLPGRSGNEIKNYWNSTLSKKLLIHNNADHHHDSLNEAESEEKKLSEQKQPEPVASTIAPPSSMQPNELHCNDQAEMLYGNENSFGEYISSISSLPVMENDDLNGSFWNNMDSEIGLFSLHNKVGQQQQELSSEPAEDEALGDYGFSFDIFS